MKNFCIITNNNKDKDYVLSKKIEGFITEKGGTCFISENSDLTDAKYNYTNPDKMPENLECVFTIGGDGTLLQAAQDLMSKDIVFLGINKGTLGFLAEVCVEDIEDALYRLLMDDFKIESRMMLKGTIIRNDKEIYSASVLNDIVIHRGADIRISDFYVHVNNQLLGKFQADGIILSTPTGSTAYNLSAGGPIARPNSNLIILTPICAHSIGQRSIVLSDEDKIEVTIGTCKNPKGEFRRISFDGDNIVEVESGDVIAIEKSQVSTKLVKLDDSSFLQTVKKKMGDK